MLAKSVFLCTALFLDHVVGQRQYGYNRRDVVRDNEAIAQFFPDVDVELFSPAFTHPETVPAGFREGLVGPTNDTVLCKFALSNHTSDYQKLTLSKPHLHNHWPTEMNG